MNSNNSGPRRPSGPRKHSSSNRGNNGNNKLGNLANLFAKTSVSAKKAHRKTQKVKKSAPKKRSTARVRSPVNYRKTYTASRANRENKPTVSKKTVTKDGKKYEITSISDANTEANKEKYRAEGFEMKREITRELRRGRKSIAVWQRVDVVSNSNANMNAPASAAAAANVSAVANQELDDLFGDLMSRFGKAGI